MHPCLRFVANANACVRIVVLAACSLSLLLANSANAVVILHANFEPPTYTLGYVHNQDNWVAGIGSPHQVTNAIVHGGTQSLNGAGTTGISTLRSRAWGRPGSRKPGATRSPCRAA
jgi:hypothetical protein